MLRDLGVTGRQGFRIASQFPLNNLSDGGIGNVEEAADIGRIVVNDAGLGLKNIHETLLLLCSVMAGDNTASHGPGEAAHVRGQMGEDIVYAQGLYSHRFPGMLVEITHTDTEFT
jgi:hypothetical protein